MLQAPISGAGGSSRSACWVASLHLLVDLVRDALQHVAVDHALVDQQLRETAAPDRAPPRPPARPPSCTAARRRRASASRAGSRARAPAPARCPRGSTAPPRASRGRTRENPCRPPPAGTGPGKPETSAEMLPPGRLALDRHGDRVAVVLDQVQQRQPLQARDVQRLPRTRPRWSRRRPR